MMGKYLHAICDKQPAKVAVMLLVLLSILNCNPTDMPLTSGMISSGNNQIYFRSEGSGSPLIFIHGGAVDHRMWQPQWEHFRHEHQVVVYDLRGHGQSDFVDNDRQDILDLIALMDSLKLEKITVGGLSLGAILALDFALAYPERVENLILISPGLVGIQEQQKSYLNAMNQLGAAFQNKDTDRAVMIMSRMTFPREYPDIAGIKSYAENAFRRFIESGNYTRIPRLAELQPVGRLEEIECPSLILYGA
ncbi:MAG: alpha/beta hydrolase, partial [Saprospiraceae bacterium]|nr:alpha/beta hydrolase [Saprospiraceae bacterium]